MVENTTMFEYELETDPLNDSTPTVEILEVLYDTARQLDLLGDFKVSSRLEIIQNTCPETETDRTIQLLFQLLTRRANSRTISLQDLEMSLPANEYGRRALAVMRLREEVAHLCIRPGLFGDRNALARKASSSGLTYRIGDMVEEIRDILDRLQEDLNAIEPLARPILDAYDGLFRGFNDLREAYDQVSRLADDAYLASHEAIDVTSLALSIASLEELGTNTDCPICRESYESSENVVLTNACLHAFHSVCLGTWVTSIGNLKTHTCPLCRREMFDPNGSLPSLILSYWKTTEDLLEETKDLKFHLLQLCSEVCPEILLFGKLYSLRIKSPSDP